MNPSVLEHSFSNNSQKKYLILQKTVQISDTVRQSSKPGWNSEKSNERCIHGGSVEDHKYNNWRLRDLALSELVPIRVRNVIQAQPANAELLNLSLDETLSRWPEVYSYLLSLRHMGETSCKSLLAALTQVVENPASTRITNGRKEPTITEDLKENTVANFPATILVELIGFKEKHQHLKETIRTDSIIKILQKPVFFKQINKPWFVDLIKDFLIESKDWLARHHGNHSLFLTDKGAQHLNTWIHKNEAALCSEWACLHLLGRSMGLAKFKQQIADPQKSPEQKYAMTKLLRSGGAKSQATRDLLLESGVLSSLINEMCIPVNGDEESLWCTNDLFELLLNTAPARHQEIILQRFAPTGEAPKTLEEVGEIFGITRERVRQITQNWLSMLENDGWKAIASKHLKIKESSWIELLQTMIDEYPLTPEIKKIANDLPKQEKILLAVTGITPEQWLRKHAYEFDEKIFLIHEDDPRISQANTFLENYFSSKRQLPILIERISDKPNHFERTVLATHLIKSGKLGLIKTESGLLLLENQTSSASQLALCISAFAEHADWLLTDQQLWHAVLRMRGNNPSRALWRTLERSLQSSPKRFRNIPRVGWIDLIDCENTEQTTEVIQNSPLLTPTCEMGSRQDAMGDDNQRGRLYSVLSEYGGMYAKECIELWSKHDETGTGSSAGFLLNDPFFVTCHPGMTGCLGEKGELINGHKIRSRLSTIEDLHTYLKFRQGGFGPHDFPAWDKAMIEIWIELANSEIRQDVANDIVEVLRRDHESCELICNKKSTQRTSPSHIGYLDSPRRPADSTLPSLEEIFRLSALATKYGFLNFYLVNCCMGSHWFSHRAVSWLAILIAAGIVEGPRHWQGMHCVTTRGLKVLKKFLHPAKTYETLDWKTVPEGQELKQLITENWQENIQDSWVSLTEFSRLHVALMNIDHESSIRLLNPQIYQLSKSRNELPKKNNSSNNHFEAAIIKELLGGEGGLS